MNLQILLEVQRVKEIMGVKPKLINEGNPFITAMIKSGNAEVRAELKNSLKSYANAATGGDVEVAIKDFEKDYSTALARSEDDAVAVLDHYFGNLAKNVDDVILRFAKEAPQEFGREVIGNLMRPEYKGLYDVYMNKNYKLSALNIEDAKNFLNDIKQSRDNIYGYTPVDGASKTSLDELATNVQKKIDDYTVSTKTLDELYDEIYVVDTMELRKKPISKEDFIKRVNSAKTKLKGKDTIDIIESLVKTAPDKQNAIQFINDFFRKKGGAGDALELAADGGIKTTSKFVTFAKTYGLAGLAATGVLLFIFNPEFYADLGQRVSQAGSKYNDVYDALGERLSGNYYDLPDDVKFFISREFTIEQAKKNETTPYIKNIEYKENTDSEAGSITIKMSDDSIVKYETSDGKTFNKVGGKNSEASSTFKVAELTKFLTGPDYGFKAEILLPTQNGSFGDYTEDQALSAGTYKFQDSTPESEGGPLTGQVKYENGVFTYIPE